jgi:carbonic anhydrase
MASFTGPSQRYDPNTRIGKLSVLHCSAVLQQNVLDWMMELAVKSQEALARIVEGVKKFQAEVYPAQREMFETLKGRQQPMAMFITCADSRVVPNLFTQTGPGDFFVERNPGNFVPRYGDFVGGVSAGVEYGMLVLKVPLVIICGHTDCGVMKGLLHTDQVNGLPAMQEWMRHASDVRHRIMRDHSNAPDEEKLRLITEYNVLAQIENLKTHPSVQSRVTSGEVEIRGWVYDIGDGSIWSADPESGEFARIGDTKPE